jgi:hypothetical protein
MNTDRAASALSRAWVPACAGMTRKCKALRLEMHFESASQDGGVVLMALGTCVILRCLAQRGIERRIDASQ